MLLKEKDAWLSDISIDTFCKGLSVREKNVAAISCHWSKTAANISASELFGKVESAVNNKYLLCFFVLDLLFSFFFFSFLT